mmetsp:Transcript_113561/g.294146  ORF Transcript_113561/g.294146 Transcript_113561/m.294146 type:complete len:377 (+) Transcript_113561:72-1202(+)
MVHDPLQMRIDSPGMTVVVTQEVHELAHEDSQVQSLRGPTEPHAADSELLRRDVASLLDVEEMKEALRLGAVNLERCENRLHVLRVTCILELVPVQHAAVVFVVLVEDRLYVAHHHRGSIPLRCGERRLHEDSCDHVEHTEHDKGNVHHECRHSPDGYTLSEGFQDVSPIDSAGHGLVDRQDRIAQRPVVEDHSGDCVARRDRVAREVVVQAMIQGELRDVHAHHVHEQQEKRYSPGEMPQRADDRHDQRPELSDEPQHAHQARDPHEPQKSHQPQGTEVLPDVFRTFITVRDHRGDEIEDLGAHQHRIKHVPISDFGGEEPTAVSGEPHTELRGESDAEEHLENAKWPNQVVGHLPRLPIGLNSQHNGVQHNKGT